MLTFNNLKITGGIGYSTVGPRPGSIYFDGSASYLTVPNATELVLGTGDLTVECWIYPTSTTQFEVIYLTNSFQFFTFGGALYMYDNGSQTSGGTISLNVWQHIAVTRSGTSLKCFINGQIVNTQVSSTNFTSGTNYVGFNGGSYASGYISNLRVVKGVAVYTANFIPSINVLPATQAANVYGIPSAAIPAGNTSLLLSTSNEPFYLQDSSANVKVISQTGAPARTGANAFYSAGSRYFNGSTEYLTAPSSSVFQLGTGDFTIEFWFYWDGPTPLNTNQYTIISNILSADNTTWDLQYYNGQWRFVAWSIASFVESTGLTGSFTGNTWNHFAVTRSSGIGQMWLNGIDITGPASFTTNLSTTRQVQIGWNGYNQYWKGYISNLRVVKGTGVYTANFIPSINVLPATQAANVYGSPSAAITSGSTSLLLNTGGLPLLDSSLNYFTITPAVNSTAASTSTNNPFYTKGSIYFNGSTNYLTANSSTSLFTFTGDFTIEMWVQPNSAVGDYALWCAGTETFNRYVTYVSNGKILTNRYGDLSINYTDVSVPTTSWSHIAFVRSGSTINVYVNGIRSSNTETQSGTVGNGPIKIGSDSSGAANFSGYLSNFRVVKDTAVYTANFIPSISILPATQDANVYGSNSSIIPAGNTTLLLNTGGLPLLDSSTYRNLVIPTGNVSGYSISPF